MMPLVGGRWIDMGDLCWFDVRLRLCGGGKVSAKFRVT
jgi:hypothetical protein